MTPFSSEADLVEELLLCVRQAKRRDWRCVTELNAGVGVADLVLYKRAPRTTKALRVLSALPVRLSPLLNPSVAFKVESQDDLAAVLGVSVKASISVAKALRLAGAARGGGEKLKIQSVPVPPFERLIAVEAKLSNWRAALVQAYRNKQFADESWVVLDSFYAQPALKNIMEFSSAGVGLATLQSYGKIMIHQYAAPNTAFSPQKRWESQAALARRIAKF